MDVSIIIVNYNTFDITCQCIESIYQFTSNISYEIILVDNASLERDPGDFLFRFPHLLLVRSKENDGFAKGNNRGIDKSSGNVILLINSDTEISDNVIGVSYHKLLHNPDTSIGVITCKLLFPDGRLQHQCGRLPSIKLQFIELFRLQKIISRKRREELLLGGFFNNDRVMYPDWIWGTFFMFKRDILKIFPNKKLPETYFMYMEDMEWCFFLNDFGIKILFDPSSSIVHHSGSSSLPFFGESLNPTIQSNFKDLVIRKKGKIYATIFFLLLELNSRISQNKKRLMSSLNKISSTRSDKQRSIF